MPILTRLNIVDTLPRRRVGSAFLPGSVAGSRPPPTSFASIFFQAAALASVGCGLSRLRLHLLLHHLLHFLHGRLRFVRTYHPGVSVRINDLAAPVAPKHIRDRALARGSKAEGLGNYFVDIFHVDK